MVNVSIYIYTIHGSYGYYMLIIEYDKNWYGIILKVDRFFFHEFLPWQKWSPLPRSPPCTLVLRHSWRRSETHGPTDVVPKIFIWRSGFSRGWCLFGCGSKWKTDVGPQMWMSSLVLTIQLLGYLILTHTHLKYLNSLNLGFFLVLPCHFSYQMLTQTTQSLSGSWGAVS